MDFSLLEIAAIAIAIDEEESTASRNGRKNVRKWGVHPIWRKRRYEGEFFTLCRDLPDDEDKFFGYFRMSKDNFQILLHKLSATLKRQQTRFQSPITPEERLAVCLRYLATGDSYFSISHSYRLGHTTVHKIVNSTCRAIVKILMREVMPQPTEEKWKEIAHDFESLWNFPNCIGALDGKHCVIEAPANSGSIFYNYKNSFSIILLALVDARYKFIMVDVGSYGRNSDGGIFAKSFLGQRLENGTLNVPPERQLPNSDTTAPYVIVADEAFPLKTYLLRPYPGNQSTGDPAKTYFNYRLSLARRLVENAFGILAQRFRIFFRRIKLAPKNVDYIVLAACTLHNFLRYQNDMTYIPSNTQVSSSVLRGSILETINQSNHPGGQSTHDAFLIRENFKNYFSSSVGRI